MAEKKKRVSKPAQTPENRERQLVNLAVNLAEKQLNEGTASAAVITHYLKMGSQRETLEREILSEKAKLESAKTEALKEAKETKAMYEEAVEAIKKYTPTGD